MSWLAGPTPSSTATVSGGPEMVDLPWGTARIAQVVNIAWSNHGPSLELLEFPDGKRALRFAAFQDGDLIQGPLVLDEDAVPHLAAAAAGARPIQAILQLLASGQLAAERGLTGAASPPVSRQPISMGVIVLVIRSTYHPGSSSNRPKRFSPGALIVKIAPDVILPVGRCCPAREPLPVCVGVRFRLGAA